MISIKRSLGITLLFKNINIESVEGILMSCILTEVSKDNIHKKINEKVDSITQFHKDYIYLGINDLFHVTGKPAEFEIIGRITYFDLDREENAKTLINNFHVSEIRELSDKFCFSSVYFCKNDICEKFTIVIKSVVEYNSELKINLLDKIVKISTDKDFINKIIESSIENIVDINFLGLHDLYPIDLKLNIFEILFGAFENEDILKEEILTNEEFEEMINDIIS